MSIGCMVLLYEGERKFSFKNIPVAIEFIFGKAVRFSGNERRPDLFPLTLGES